VVRSLEAPRRLVTVEEVAEFEQELVDQYLLAMVGAGITDGQVARERSVVFAFIGFLQRPVWTAAPADADRFLADQRRKGGLAHSTVRQKAQVLADFFEFVDRRCCSAADRRVQPSVRQLDGQGSSAALGR